MNIPITTGMINSEKEILGVITHEVIFGVNIFRDIMSKWRDLVGGKSGSYTKVIASAKEEIFKEIIKQGAELGADAIEGFRFSINSFPLEKTSMPVIFAYGTAIKIKRHETGSTDKTESGGEKVEKESIPPSGLEGIPTIRRLGPIGYKEK